jgi:hypothetical protein
MVASTVSMTALVSVISLMIWLYGLIRASNTHRCQIRAGSGQTSLVFSLATNCIMRQPSGGVT